MNGTVKWFDSKKGYGFINGDDGKEYFVHYSHIYMRDKFKTLDEDDIVRFDVGTDDNGKEQAINVNPLITRKWIKRALEKDKLADITKNVNMKYTEAIKLLEGYTGEKSSGNFNNSRWKAY